MKKVTIQKRKLVNKDNPKKSRTQYLLKVGTKRKLNFGTAETDVRVPFKRVGSASNIRDLKLLIMELKQTKADKWLKRQLQIIIRVEKTKKNKKLRLRDYSDIFSKIYQ